MDLAAKRYGQRPSSLIRLPPDDPAALDFDIAVALRAVIEEREELERLKREAGLEDGTREIDAERIPAGKGMSF